MFSEPVASVKRALADAGAPDTVRVFPTDVPTAAYSVLWAGAGDHNSMFSITYKDLHRITCAEGMPVR